MPERNMLFSQGTFAKPRRVWFPGSVSAVRGAGLWWEQGESWSKEQHKSWIVYQSPVEDRKDVNVIQEPPAQISWSVNMVRSKNNSYYWRGKRRTFQQRTAEPGLASWWQWDFIRGRQGGIKSEHSIYELFCLLLSKTTRDTCLEPRPVTGKQVRAAETVEGIVLKFNSHVGKD